MNLWEEAEKISLFGIDMYTFGVFCAIGAAAAALAVVVICRAREIRKGVAGLTILMSLVCGIVISRLGFCLMNQSLGSMMPLSSWFRITEGGWCMSGMIVGALLGGRLAGRIGRENPDKLTDAVAGALPLMIAAVKYGESKIPDFDISRALAGDYAGSTFFFVTDKYGSYLATHRIGMILALILFLIMTFRLMNCNRRDGDQTILFLLLCGAGGILLESLRYDHFLELSFVRLEMVIYALMLAGGMILAVRRRENKDRKAAAIAAAAVVTAVGVTGGVEFALDRTTINHVLLYLLMIAALAFPVIYGIRLLQRKGTKQA